MASPVVTGIGIALVSAMFVLASAAPSATVASSLFGIMLMIGSDVGPSAGCIELIPILSVGLATRTQLGARTARPEI
jgi:hypothetical protein